MSVGKASALTLGLLSAIALGVWISPYIRDHQANPTSESLPQVTQPSKATAHNPETMPAPRKATVRPRPPIIQTSAPELQEHLRPLLNRGTNMTIAAEGFRNAEQFATLAHAARNTQIPFVVLKHRVLAEGKPLAAAIRESKPDMNSVSEANRARAEARSDIAKLRG